MRVGRLFLAASLAAAAPLPAQDSKDPHAVQPERPTVATHAGTVAPGWLEIETGIERDRFGPGVTSTSSPTLFKLGLTHNTQLSVFGPLVQDSAATGPGDVSVGVKWRLLDDAPFVGDFAVLPTLKFPTGSARNGIGTGTTDVSLLLISSHELGPVSMDINAGLTRRSGNGSNAPQSATLWTFSFGGPVGGSMGWTAECYGLPATTGSAGQASIVALLAGPTFLVKKWLALDAGVIVPLAGPQPHALYAGGVYNVGRM